MNVGYIISSNVQYQEKTLPLLKKSLDIAGIHEQQYLIFIGGSKDYKSDNIIHVPYTGWENTALIGASELDLPFDFVFLLHDTCSLGSNSKYLIETGFNHEVDITSFCGSLCSFGMYRVSFLKRISSYLQSLKNITKFDAIAHEGLIWRNRLGTTDVYPNDYLEERGTLDIYNTGIPRLIEYYGAVDMIKYKANWGQTNPDTYVVKM